MARALKSGFDVGTVDFLIRHDLAIALCGTEATGLSSSNRLPILVDSGAHYAEDSQACTTGIFPMAICSRRTAGTGSTTSNSDSAAI
jgi:hypothetical protein